jgi:hypothetical protein
LEARIMPADWKLKVQYTKNCSCDPGCPCDFWAPPTRHFCEGFNAMHIVTGHYNATKLDGINVAFSFHFPGPLHEGNGTLQLYIDDKTTPAQREALLAILSGSQGGPWFQLVASLIKDFLPPKFTPVKFEFDLAKRQVKCSADGAEAVVEPIVNPATKKAVPARVHLAEGIEYLYCDIAVAKKLKSGGKIQFNHTGVHSCLAELEYTPTGVKQ